MNMELFLATQLMEAGWAINSMKTEAEAAAQLDEEAMLEALGEISRQGLEADMAIRAALTPQSGAASGAAPAGYEHQKAIQEGERIGASDAYFAARSEMLDTHGRRKAFEAGFDRGYAAALASLQATPED